MQNPQNLNTAFTLAEKASNIINYVEGNSKRLLTTPNTHTKSQAVPMELGNIHKPSNNKGKQHVNTRSNPSKPNSNVICNYCKKPGHFKRDCYALKRAQGASTSTTNPKYADLINMIDELVESIEEDRSKN